MKSHCRFRLSRKMLSLYSSETEIEGVSVTGPRCAPGARSPSSSRGYAAIGRLGGTGAGAVAVPGAWAPTPRGGASWPHAKDAIRLTTIPTIALTRRTGTDYRGGWG